MLDRVTITGADDNTDPLWMLDLALAYPFLEWGVLVSQSREGSPRYPSRKWQEKLLKSAHRMNLSMHVCGVWARKALGGGGLDWIKSPIRYAAQRIQINGTPPIDTARAAYDSVFSLSVPQPHVRFIVQYPRAAEYIIATWRHGLKYVPLFDESGGEGRQVRNWSDIPNCDYIGYAGGIGPNDVKETVGSIMAFRKGPFWIDSEGKMRDSEDRLDARKAERHLDICEGIIYRPAFNEVMIAAEIKQEASR